MYRSQSTANIPLHKCAPGKTHTLAYLRALFLMSSWVRITLQQYPTGTNQLHSFYEVMNQIYLFYSRFFIQRMYWQKHERKSKSQFHEVLFKSIHCTLWALSFLILRSSTLLCFHRLKWTLLYEVEQGGYINSSNLRDLIYEWSPS